MSKMSRTAEDRPYCMYPSTLNVKNISVPTIGRSDIQQKSHRQLVSPGLKKPFNSGNFSSGSFSPGLQVPTPSNVFCDVLCNGHSAHVLSYLASPAVPPRPRHAVLWQHFWRWLAPCLIMCPGLQYIVHCGGGTPVLSVSSMLTCP